MIEEDLASFIESPVMQIVGTADEALKPEIGRGAGAWASADRRRVFLVLSAWQWPGTVANLKANGRVAVTFARPADYVSYQVKGAATLQSAVADEIDRSARYLAEMVSTLMRLGIPAEVIAPWLSNRDPFLVGIEVSDIFLQTPGAKAGTRLWSATV
ncbi:hypothetical protein AU381_19370 [Sinorhizobium glycinis]|uniref:Pyridoxamine 5'-phosphate oxidase putative domain-containing protein n=1 Tax=Sinorhizobium glycinis TaxID=1472378 RepID=A0A178XN19_9HYPH|nr:hypothetical protein [Sinorhizobium glycinis]OAP36648.1 hypothetical protein AU381_19370 [Sinorhizobium glycinis]